MGLLISSGNFRSKFEVAKVQANMIYPEAKFNHFQHLPPKEDMSITMRKSKLFQETILRIMHTER